ncbi:NAD-dependent DNA ligase LigA [Hominisplanchenecus murintestinalis]|uniref:NAD-dependent DNA ligase LigA n=1 Tax=Hominisplanchenecus murintestinalis TaxID=2941517 RepID=A0AC61R1R5_9FIRM|nr:NAD-dependent DNA ligase LigA [Hominisplanchenecus murintestinalis]TGY00133.1 NAD-dependent DNA ligase LigA [Hominisplanchenecus murintestinalis]
MDIKLQRIKELTKILTEAGKAYYQENREIMSNFEYDKLYDELSALERETGIVLAGSPTVTVGYESVQELPKERHEQPMLSLDKTKDVEALKSFVGEQKALVSWKLDGLTIVLTYRDGGLFKAVTRGNGEVGEVITGNARVFENIPLSIPYKGELILRGEAVISYSDFVKINEEIEDVDAKYKNPRNLCSGSVRQLNNEITAARHVNFYAFSLVKAEGVDFKNSRKEQFAWMQKQGFCVVEHRIVTGEDVPEAVEWFARRIQEYDIPSDGLVVVYDDIAYGQSLGTTAKFPRDSIAFKWKDEIRNTHLLEIEWSPSRTGLINPVAIFEPVELEGTTVSRASVHNLSIMKALELGIQDEIQVYKANMIIPQIAENLTRSGNVKIPETCPVCGGATHIQKANDVETLYCTNEECQAKKLKLFTLFVSRNALNIDGLSEATLEKFIGRGFIHEFADIFELDKHREEIVEMEGFGIKSYENLMAGIAEAQKTTQPRLLYGLGIPNVGVANAKMICKAFQYNLGKIRSADAEELAAVDGIGPVIGKTVAEYFASEKNSSMLDRLLEKLEIEIPDIEASEQVFAGMNFVITGSVQHYSNRNEMKSLIEEKGGKVTGSVTSKTTYLINNDAASSSSKNKKAKALGIPIISEEDFMKML